MAQTSEGGGWDQDLESGRTGPLIVRQTPKSKPKAKVVRDDWDDDDDGEDLDSEPEQNRDTKTSASRNKIDGMSKENEGEESGRIWEEANKRTPMPELIVAPASTSQGVAPPPPAALQPTLRILKRPSPGGGPNYAGAISPSSSSGPSSASGGTSPAPRGTLAEREAQYQEARSRIFGEKEKAGGSNPGLNSRASSGGVVITRDPLGPASELGPELGGQDKVHGIDRPAKGFGERRRGKKM